MDTWYSAAYKTIATREDMLPSTNKDELGPPQSTLTTTYKSAIYRTEIFVTNTRLDSGQPRLMLIGKARKNIPTHSTSHGASQEKLYMPDLGFTLALLAHRILVFIPRRPTTMGLFGVPELNTREGIWRAYHLAAIVL
jgi:hypothetical protein